MKNVTKFGLLALVVGPAILQAHDLRICKASDPAGPVTGTFTFSVTGQDPVSVAVGSCTTVPGVGTDPITIVEQAVAGVVVTAITAEGASSVTGLSLPDRTITVTVPGDGLVTVTFTNLATVAGRFTGGGSVFTASGVRITHGFELHCSTADLPNSLEINRGADNFHLLTLTSATCTVNSETGVATITGTGTGRWNGVEGFTVYFTITDAGEPGTRDFASFLITTNGTEVLNVAANLTFGNQQFHPAR